MLRSLIAAAEKRKPDELAKEDLLAGAALRGLVWHDPASGEHYATAAGIVLLAKDPSAVFPQCRILADAYRSTEPDGDPRDHEDIRGPMPLAIERAIAFIDRNTRHPMRIVGLNRVRLDEYPVDGLREALVNAVAHRQYEDAGRKIILEVFADRVVLSSPGLPPKPITLASLRKGNTGPVRAIRSWPSVFPIFTASRSAAAASAGCATRCSTTGSISRSSVQTWDTSRSPSRGRAKTSSACGCLRSACWSLRR